MPSGGSTKSRSRWMEAPEWMGACRAVAHVWSNRCITSQQQTQQPVSVCFLLSFQSDDPDNCVSLFPTFLLLFNSSHCVCINGVVIKRDTQPDTRIENIHTGEPSLCCRPLFFLFFKSTTYSCNVRGKRLNQRL